MKPLRTAIYLFIFVAVVAVIALVTDAPAQGPQSQCYAHAELLAKLKKQYNESRIGFGTVPTNFGQRIIEMSLSDDGSWSIYIVDPTGLACVMVSGRNWQFSVEGPTPETQTN